MRTTRIHQNDTRCWIYGTWDFKWPHDYTIQVAFQQLHPVHAGGEAAAADLLERAIALFMETAQRWFNSERRIALSFHDSSERLPPPDKPDQAQSRTDSRMREYDLLVSFAPLPLQLPRKSLDRDKPATTDRIETQSAELGCYAWRADYGVPTLFLGPTGGECGAAALDRWLKGEQFQASALHEFGHALGLAHEHQNPLYRLRSLTPKSKQHILDILAGDPRFEHYPASEIEEEITSTWPHLPIEQEGSVPFSDWRTPPENVVLETHTAMIHPGWSAFIAGAPDGPIAPERTYPTEWDQDQLAFMYPQRGR